MKLKSITMVYFAPIPNQKNMMRTDHKIKCIQWRTVGHEVQPYSPVTPQPTMSKSLPCRLHRRISEHISLKNRQLRNFSKYLLDVDFVCFAEIVEEAELHLESLLEHSETNFSDRLLLEFLERKLESISRAKEHCIRKLQHFVELHEAFQVSQFQNIFFQRLSR